jgi:hypothetical protein
MTMAPPSYQTHIPQAASGNLPTHSVRTEFGEFQIATARKVFGVSLYRVSPGRETMGVCHQVGKPLFGRRVRFSEGDVITVWHRVPDPLLPNNGWPGKKRAEFLGFYPILYVGDYQI